MGWKDNDYFAFIYVPERSADYYGVDLSSEMVANSEPTDRLKTRFKAAIRRGTGLIDITVKDTDAKRAQRLAEVWSKILSIKASKNRILAIALSRKPTDSKRNSNLKIGRFMQHR